MSRTFAKVEEADLGTDSSVGQRVQKLQEAVLASWLETEETIKSTTF